MDLKAIASECFILETAKYLDSELVANDEIHDATIRIAVQTATRAVAEAEERLRELVCDKCGVTLDGGWHPPDTVDDCLVEPWRAVTRAEYEHLHKADPDES